MGNDSEKSQGLERAERMESNNQTQAQSGEPTMKKKGPAYGGGTSGNPTSGGKIKR